MAVGAGRQGGPLSSARVGKGAFCQSGVTGNSKASVIPPSPRLTGKVQEVCAALSVEDSLDYEVVKGAILRAYELVQEVYRQQFRDLGD